MHYPNRENKGAGQFCGFREADLWLCFRICPQQSVQVEIDPSIQHVTHPSSENKGAGQFRGFREADLRLCFRICNNPGLLFVFFGGGLLLLVFSFYYILN